MTKTKLILFFSLIYVINIVEAQSIAGAWQGNIIKASPMRQPKFIQFYFTVSADSLVTGSTHLIYKRGKFEHYSILGKLSNNDSLLVFNENATLGLRLGNFDQYGKATYTLKLVRRDSIVRYEGVLSPILQSSGLLLPRKVFLERKNTSLQKIKTENTRLDSIMSLIEVNKNLKDSIKIELYDDAIVDGDIISFELNDKVVANNIRLSDKAEIVYFTLDQTKLINKLRIVAKSEGDIPPCTGILYITVNKVKHRIDMRSTYKTNGVIQFFLK